MRLVVLESPFAGHTPETALRNIAYAWDCLSDCLKRGESPIASHLLFPQILKDSVPEERRLGIDAGHAWIPACDAVVVYEDFGITPGMLAGIKRAEFHNAPSSTTRPLSIGRSGD